MEEIARDYVTFARQLSASGCYAKAFDLYLMAFEKNSASKDLFEPEFRMVLIRLNEVLAVGNRIEDIFLNFGRAINAFPSNVHLLNDIGKNLYKFGFYTEAWCHFQKALKIDSGYVNAEKNLNSVKNLLVERWHFRMLNDKVRNEAYHSAIQQTVVPYKDSVLDLGTGSGLLALYAAECSPMATTACDGSEVMAKMAETIMHDHQRQEVIVVNNMSTDMDYRDIGGKRSLLVTELFDAGLFGEHILQSISHAREHLITNDAKVIPNKAEFFVAGAKCDHLMLKYQLGSQMKRVLNISNANVHVITYNETYDCDDVHLLKDLKYMTEAQSLLKVDFNDLNDVQETLNRKEPYVAEFKALENGEIDVVIGWFNLYLTDNITLTTDPRSKDRANAWQQAVFFDNVPQQVKENQVIKYDFLINGGKIAMVQTKEVMRVSPETLRFLNDEYYIKMITKCIGMASVYLGQMTEMSQINMVDLCPFPYFGFLMLKRGIQSLTCWARTEADKKFFKKVFKANKIPLSKITVLVGEEWSQNVFRDEKYHAIFCNIFDLSGDIDLRIKEIAQHLKHAHLLRGGLFMPASISIVGQVVSSHWLDVNNRVYDENVNNYRISMHMNKYQVSQNFWMDFTCLEYTPLTEPAVLGKYQSGMRSEVVNVPIIEDGEASGILCWYNIEVMEQLGEIVTNKGNSFIDSIAFLANPPVRMERGKMANVLRCIDADGAFKLVIDVEGEAT